MKKNEIDVVRTKSLSYISMAIFAVIALGACSYDEPEPEETFIDVLQKDKAVGSISQEEFQEKVMNKVWTRIKKEEDVFIDVDGNEYDWGEYMFTGWWASEAYYFDSEKYVDFYTVGPGSSLTDYYRRASHQYKYDSQTGMVYVAGAMNVDKTDNQHILFYIESVNDNEMIVHDIYQNIPGMGFKDPGEDGYNLCGRILLKAVKEEDVKKNWWDKYTPVD